MQTYSLRLNITHGHLIGPSEYDLPEVINMPTLLAGDGEAPSDIARSVATYHMAVATRYGGCMTQRDYSTMKYYYQERVLDINLSRWNTF